MTETRESGGMQPAAGVRVETLTFSDGTQLAVPTTGLVLVVGPNNSGKSQVLRDIYDAAANDGTRRGTAARSVTMVQYGSADEFERSVRSHGTVEQSSGVEHVRMRGASQMLSSALQWWQNGNMNLVAPYFVRLAATEERLSLSHPTEQINLYSRQAVFPLHYLFVRPELEAQIAEVANQAFGTPVFLDRWGGGNMWSLRMGSVPASPTMTPDAAFMEAIQATRLLEQQGDGVRSLVGLVLVLRTGWQTVTLVDEPEAFLHPPQARFLGSLLARDASETGTQVVVSTHSSDVVLGVLDVEAPATVVRLRREGDVNHASILDNDAIRQFWSDPLLRYSNLLEGLFTDAVVICESDADCRFYSSILDTIKAAEGAETQRLDLQFSHCGGKHRLHAGAAALRAAQVPVAVIADFDLLNDWSVLERLVTAMGGDASLIEADWKTLDGALKGGAKQTSVATIRDAVKAELDACSTTTFEKADAERVRGVLKVENAWDRAKQSGIAAVPNGDPYQACDRILTQLSSISVHVVRSGTLESFAPSAAGHGPGWVAEVLTKRLHEQGETDPARLFVRGVVENLAL